jgi:hypothetical protein
MTESGNVKVCSYPLYNESSRNPAGSCTFLIVICRLEEGFIPFEDPGKHSTGLS